MAWSVHHDQSRYEAARALRREYRRMWTILWSPSKRAFYAYFHGPEHVRPLIAPTSDDLRRDIHHCEYRISRDRAGYTARHSS
ncbi:hypothetical protein [Nocardiopsis sp. YSL2]|uniref:hypothetical protein n=1 Tax=Nocardiopsis sp. YSL2 TaxID=2939492 RepID=UPI0026F46429|nr:hypothetical protein [Nocardiopsis sp. YSL2]